MFGWVKRIIRSGYPDGTVHRVMMGKNKGFRFISSADLNLNMMLGFHEPNSLNTFDAFVRKGMIVADIGAHVGYFSRYLSMRVGPHGQVFAFEPVPDNFLRLEQHIELNALKNVTAVRAAVTNEDSPVSLYLGHNHYMASVISNMADGKGAQTVVDGITLDNYFKQQGIMPDFIKMDIEGAAGLALEGAREIIDMADPIFMFECHTSVEDLAIGQLLCRKTYEVFRVGSNKEIKFLDRDHNNEFGIYGTLICIPLSRVEALGKWTPASFQKRYLFS